MASTDTRLDLRDYFILAHVNMVGIASTVYLFMHASDIVFGSWCGLVTTLVGSYHWFIIRDSKTPDAGN